MSPKLRSIAVFCGSRTGARPEFLDAARAFGTAMARRGCDLVYGGAANGLMGAVADAVHAGGRKVIGVIPKGLDRVEFAHPKLSERVDVATMHDRKAVMTDRADAIVALPGGLGTMDELFEALSWRQLAIHHKPVGLLDVGGFYEPLVAWLDGAVSDGFVAARHRSILHVDTSADALLARLFSEGT